MNRASKSKAAENTFLHKRETSTDMVEDPLIHSQLALNDFIFAYVSYIYIPECVGSL